MTTELYNLHTDGDEYRITKFIDGEVASSYLLSETECECPAGHHFTCRHRKMLPAMLAAEIVNTHWFWDREIEAAVDINGVTKAEVDALDAHLPQIVHNVDIHTDADLSDIKLVEPRKPWRRL